MQGDSFIDGGFLILVPNESQLKLIGWLNQAIFWHSSSWLIYLVCLMV